jgi:Xaa-Pro aminopeptidase
LEAIMDKEFYTANRRRLAANLEDGDLMLFFSGEGVRKTADENYPFFTNRNFLYLTGIQQERTALLLQRRHGELSSSLFALTPDPAREVWTGRRFTWDEMAGLSGVTQIEDFDSLERVLDGLVAARPAVTLWLCFDALRPRAPVRRAHCYPPSARCHSQQLPVGVQLAQDQDSWRDRSHPPRHGNHRRRHRPPDEFGATWQDGV